MIDDEFPSEATTQSLGMPGLGSASGPGSAASPTVPITHVSATSPTVPVLPESLPQHTIPFEEPGTTALVQPVMTFPTTAFTQPMSVRGRRRRLRLIVPLVVMFALVAGGGYFAYQHFVVGKESGARAAVSAYFQDIQAGDAAAATSLATGPYQDTPIVGPATIADAANRPTGFAILSSAAVPSITASHYRRAGVTGSDLTYVAVRYSVNHTALSDTYLAEKVASSGKWLLVDPYRVLSVSDGRSSTVTVDGVSFSEQNPIEVFPGVHVVAEPSDPDFVPVGTTASLTEGTSTQLYTWTKFAAVTLPSTTPILTAEGKSAVQVAYRAALGQCATAAETGSGACGIDDKYNFYTCNHVTWTITTVGAADVDLSTQNADGSYDFTANGSVASESGDYSDFFGGDQTFSNQTTDLEASAGTIVFHSDGTATATLTS